MTSVSTIVRALVAAMTALLLAAGSDAAAGDRRKAPGGRIEPAVLYHNYCSVCHGDNGDGNSRAKNSLIPAPANFTDPALSGRLTREYIAAIVAHGKPRTAMVGWKTQLNEREIDALAEYVRVTFVDRAGDAGLLRERSLYGEPGGISGASAHGGRERDQPR